MAMSLLYVNEDGTLIGIDGNRLAVKYSDGLLRSVPIETVDSITILGQAQLTTQCIRTCLERGIPVAFFQRAGDISAIFILQAIWMPRFRESRASCTTGILLFAFRNG